MTVVRVSTPSRLHFGLLRLHETAERSFGGLGMMIDKPRVEIELMPAVEWTACGPGANRANDFAKLALGSLPAGKRPTALDIRITSLIPQHRGLGGGTQLALAVAAGVRELAGLAAATAAELAASVGRGSRSAVGSHGFLHGGLIWEHGRVQNEPLADLSAHIALPDEWRVVLFTPPGSEGLSGKSERMAFERLPQVPSAITRQLKAIAEDEVLPAARAADCNAFGDAVYRYGRLSGECFAPIQGGPYASAEIAATVAAVRKLGVPGVGQSSWGPTVFAVTSSQTRADEFVAAMLSMAAVQSCDFSIAAPDNHGAIVNQDFAPNSGPPDAAKTL